MRTALTRYDNAPLRGAIEARYRGSTRTQLPIGRGTRQLRDYIAARHGITTTYMPGRSRPMTDAQRLDMHQAGRAIDFMTSDVAKGTAIAEELAAIGDRAGIQLVIFAGNVWSQGQPSTRRFAKYTGASGHYDHLHVEVNEAGAAGTLPWYETRGTPPTAAQLLADASGPEAPLLDEGAGFSGLLTYGAIAVAALAAIAGAVALSK